MAEAQFSSRMTGRQEAALEVAVGDGLAGRGRFAEACVHYERAIDLEPGNAAIYCQLGACQWRLGRVQAGAAFQKAIDLNPRLALAHAALAAWYLQQGMVESADECSRCAIEIAPVDEKVIHSRAAVLEAVGELESAWNLIEPLIQRGFAPIPVVRLYGRMARYHDHQDQALRLIEKQLKEGNQSAQDRARLHFTAAELLDSLGRFDEAFDQARRANELARPVYDLKAHERTFDRLIEYFTPDRLRSLARARDCSEKPVFIVGMPRSGTSLVEQILASHPAVHGGGELDFMSHVWAGTVQMVGARGNEYPSCLDRLTMDQVEGMGQIYLQPLVGLNPAAVRITDKLPLNFLHLGLIAMLLPGARVIDCHRDARDTCLSCYLAMFESGNEFKYDLNHTAHFFNQSRRLMEHWNEVLDIPILEVKYESLVNEPETQTRRMLDFMKLSWDEACLDFHHSKRPVTSSSVQQVRRPIYQSSVGRWRDYEKHLNGLNWWFDGFR